MYFTPLLSVFLGFGISVTVSAQSIVDAVKAQDQLSTLLTLINAQPALFTALSSAQNITLLAPSNDAFGQFLDSDAGIDASSQLDVVAALLSYHVINGAFNSAAFSAAASTAPMPMFLNTLLTNVSYTGVTGGQVVEVVAMNGAVNVFSGLKSKATVTTPDLAFSGGFIHIIDTVLTIPPNISTTALMSNLTQLASAVTNAGLLSAIDNTPNITVFAPTDSAFSAIADTVKGLSTDQLASILQYHVVPALGYSSLLKTESLPTLEGQSVNVVVDGGSVKVNSANVIVADVIVQNGVVHVIDSVLSSTNTGGSSSGSGSAPSGSGSTSSPGSTPSGSTSTGGGSGSGSSTVKSGGLSIRNANMGGLVAGVFSIAALLL